MVIPLYLEVYSQKAKDFLSENYQLFKVIDTASLSTGNKGIYDIDNLFGKFLKKGQEKRFAVRLVGKRCLVRKGAKKNSLDLATSLPCPHETVLIKYKNGNEQKTTVSCNAVPVRLPGKKYPLFLVVVKGLGKKTDDAFEPLPCKYKTQRRHMAYRRNLSYPLEV
jgi:hypothetical protein